EPDVLLPRRGTAEDRTRSRGPRCLPAGHRAERLPTAERARRSATVVRPGPDLLHGGQKQGGGPAARSDSVLPEGGGPLPAPGARGPAGRGRPGRAGRQLPAPGRPVPWAGEPVRGGRVLPASVTGAGEALAAGYVAGPPGSPRANVLGPRAGPRAARAARGGVGGVPACRRSPARHAEGGQATGATPAERPVPEPDPGPAPARPARGRDAGAAGAGALGDRSDR